MMNGNPVSWKIKTNNLKEIKKPIEGSIFPEQTLPFPYYAERNKISNCLGDHKKLLCKINRHP
jgi:hypothetical protein